MKWKMIHSGNAQEDTVGNILQIGGGIVPKACQKCKKKFESKVVKEEIKQDVPSFKCDTCDFDGNSGDQAFVHTLDFPKHKISRKTKSRIVGYNSVLEGRLSYITKTKNDVVILCGDCNVN